MNKIKITYYATTGIISAMMLFIAFETLTKPEVKISMAHLGFPDYFRIELGIAKIIGAVLIWLPVRLLRDTAYIGFAIMFFSASLSHAAVSDPLGKVITGVIFLAILIVSFVCGAKLQKTNRD
ncbi:DoxX family protein [Pedobacter lithocola]|uniref:DoxX family protein n=1 Tax=Pedobacter lithocola TaxID=1908239 RepID=A0ABV8P4G3_9SPHI